MASIRSRVGKDGQTTFTVQVRVHGYPPQTRTFARRTDARIWAQQTEVSIRRGDGIQTNEARKHTLSELIERYLLLVARRTPDALPKQRQILGWWKERLGRYALVNITPALIAEKRDELLAEEIGKGEKRKRRAATANRYLAALSKAYTEAVREWHWVNENPLRRVSKEKEPQGRVRYLSEHERTALLTACRESRLPQLEVIVLLAITTGMRRGEILSLRWSDVDLKRRLAVIQKSKNGERRSVPLVSDVVVLLETLKDSSVEAAGAIFKQAGGGDLVHIDYWFADALKQAKIDNFRFHDLRHTAASYLAMSGATPGEIAAVLGHKTLQMVKRYAHLSDAHSSTVVERMTQKFFPRAA